MGKENPRNFEELRAYIQESQLAITQEIKVRLMESISRRLEGCLHARNRFIDNQFISTHNRLKPLPFYICFVEIFVTP